MSKGFARSGWPRGNAVLVAGTITASATPHTKGSWVQIHAAVPNDVCGIGISFGTIGAAGVDTSMLLDVGIGAAAAEAVVVPNIPLGGFLTGLKSFLPIAIPAGSRIAARIQGAVISDTLSSVWSLLYGGGSGAWAGYSIAETIGVDTATSGPTTGDLADNAWDQAIASTANAYRALTLHPCSVPGSTAMSAISNGVIDIGVGGAGSEIVLGSAIVSSNSNESLTIIETPLFIEKSIEAGSRLAIRKNGTADLSAALIGWR